MATLALDDRRLLVELQSLGVRVDDARSNPEEIQGRRGGAGPSDLGFMWVRGLPLTVPMHGDVAARSPYTLRITDAGGELAHGKSGLAFPRHQLEGRVEDLAAVDAAPAAHALLGFLQRAA